MSYDDDHSSSFYVLLMFVGFLLLFIAVMLWKWYSAGVQLAIYKRQGIEMTHWEVFIGATPAERVVQIKETVK